jgi:hypothetical protein
MQIGCGVYAHSVRGRSYLYFWHYETEKGRRRQAKEYLGAANLRVVRDEAARRVDAYFREARRELERLRKETLATIASRRAMRPASSLARNQP